MSIDCPLLKHRITLKRDPLCLRLRLPSKSYRTLTAIECPFGTSFRIMHKCNEIAKSVGAVATFRNYHSFDGSDVYAVFDEPYYANDIEVVFHFRSGDPERVSHEHPQYTFEGSFRGLVHSIIVPDGVEAILHYKNAGKPHSSPFLDGDIELCRSENGVMTLAHAYEGQSKVFATVSHKNTDMSQDLAEWQRKSCVNLSRLSEVYLSACNAEGHPLESDTLDITLMLFEPMVDGHPKHGY